MIKRKKRGNNPAGHRPQLVRGVLDRSSPMGFPLRCVQRLSRPHLGAARAGPEFCRAGVAGPPPVSAEPFRGLPFADVDLCAVDLGGLLVVLRRPFPRSVPRFDAIHADKAAELVLVSSGITMLFSRAIFSANNICAGLAGLEPMSKDVSTSAFLGACWSRNARQIDPDFVYPGGGFMPFCRATLLAKRFIACVGGRPPASQLTAAPSSGGPPTEASSLSLPMMR